GTAWGAFNALMLLFVLEPDEEEAALGLAAGQLAGFTTGALLLGKRPTAGQVALANSGGQWAAVLMGLMLPAASPNPSDREISLSLLVAADIGIGMGAYLKRVWPDVSRAQTLVVDAAGIVGGFGGGGLGVLISGDTGSQTTAAMAALGVAAG